MPSGFIGNASRVFLTHTSEALTEASQTSNHILAKNRMPRGNQVRPITPNEAARGGFQTGVGDSSNIVVDSHTYEQALRAVDRIDDRIGELLYRITTELEEMCKTSYIIPQTESRFLFINGCVKSSIGQFRGLTEEIAIGTRRFVRNITEIS